LPAQEGARLIAEDIVKGAKREASRIIEEAEQEARRILEEAKRISKQEAERKVSEARDRARYAYEEILAKGRMRTKNMLLEKREELIDRVFKEVEERLKKRVSSKVYEKDLVRIACDACNKLGADEVIVRANPKDLRLLQKYRDEIAGKVGKRISFGDPIETVGGVRVSTSDGKIEVDDTLEGRMKRNFEDLRTKVAKILFEGLR